MSLPCSAAASDNTVVSAQSLDSEFINMPDHARLKRSMYSRSVIFMRACGFHHAATVIYSGFNLFDHRGSSGSGGTKGCMYTCAAE